MNDGENLRSREVAARFLRNRKLHILAAAVLLYALCGFFLLPYLVQRYTPNIIADNLDAMAEIGTVRINPFRLTLEAEDFRLRDPGNRPIGGFDRLRLNFELSSIFHWAWTFSEVRFDTPVVAVVFDPGGRINLTELMPPRPESEPKSGDGGPPRLLLRNLAIQNGEIDIIDRRQRPPATVRMRPLNFELAQISTLPERRGPYNLIASSLEGESLHWTGRVSMNPLHSIGTVSFQNIQAATVWKFFRNRVDLEPPEGTLDVSTTYEVSFTGGKPQLTLGSLGLHLAGLTLTRTGVREPFLKLGEMAVSAADFDLQARRLDANLLSVEDGQLSIRVDKDGDFNLGGILQDSPGAENPRPGNSQNPEGGSRPWRVDLNRFRLDRFGLTFTRPGLTATLDNASVGFGLVASAGPQAASLQIQDLSSTLSGLRAQPEGADSPPLVIEEIALDGGRFVSDPPELSAERMAAIGGRVDVVRETDGSINLIRLFELPQGEALDRKRESAVKESAFRFDVATVALEGLSASFFDRKAAASEPIVFLDPINLTVSDFDGRSPSKFEAALTLRRGGSLTASGSFDPAGPSLQAKLALEQLSLEPLQPYLQQVARLRLTSGRLSSSGQLQYGAGTKFQGDFTVTALKVMEESSGDELIGWEKMESSRLALTLDPDRFELGEVVLSGFFGKLVIEKGGTVNLARAVRDRGDRAQTAAGDSRSQPKDFPATIERVRFRDGKLDFADFTLPTPFATLIHDLEGIIAGVSSKSGARAQIELEGRVDEYGAASIDGEMNAFDPLAFTDVSMRFRNVAMANLSPYSARFAGRRIEGGKLSLDLEYEIDHSQLTGDNQIVIERLDLGEPVQSPEAVNLPLDLAVALLADSSGVIDIGLPVRGDLNDPEFSFGHLIWKALVNLLTKAVTSPFRLLGSLVGAEEENLEAVAFEPGDSEVPPPEKEKLHKLARALQQRPQLHLAVQGRYAPQADGRRLKVQKLRRELAARTGREVGPEEDPGPVAFDSPKVHAALQELYVEAFGEEAYEALQPAEPGPPDPTETSPEPPPVDANPNRQWKEYFDQLVEVQTLAEGALPALARARAQAVVEEMTANGGISPQRLATREPAPIEADAQVNTQLSLEPGKA